MVPEYVHASKNELGYWIATTPAGDVIAEAEDEHELQRKIAAYYQELVEQEPNDVAKITNLAALLGAFRVALRDHDLPVDISNHLILMLGKKLLDVGDGDDD